MSQDFSFTGTGEFKLHHTSTNDPSAAVLGPAVGFGDGNVTVNPEVSTAEITRARRGLNVSVDDRVTAFQVSYDLELNRLGFPAANVIFFGNAGTSSEDNSRGASASIESFNFNTGSGGIACVPGRWYPLLDDADNNKHIRHITSVTLSGAQMAYGSSGTSTALEEGVDFEVDLELGMIKFMAAISNDTIGVTPTLPAITATDKPFKRAIIPLQRAKWSGIGSVQVYGEDETLIWEHTKFGVDLIPDGNLEFSSETPTVARIKANVVAPLGDIQASQLT